MSAKARQPAVAGVFYPSVPDELRRSVRAFLDAAGGAGDDSPKALIVPHAGYMYSGAVAAVAYARVLTESIRRVVLIGPAHRVLLRGLAVPRCSVWETPLGEVFIDFEAVDLLRSLLFVNASDEAHLEEHCLEVQLPFLQETIPAIRLIPILVGQASPDQVAEALNAVWGGPETLVLVSSDLSHYENYEDGAAKDLATARAIEDLDVRGVEADAACGLLPIAGLLQVARQRGLRAQRLDLRSSGDTAGRRDSVVGYGAFAFYE